MPEPVRLLIKTTIPTTEDDWHVGRFSRLTARLAGTRDRDGRPVYAVTARDRIETDAGGDADIEAAARGAYDQVWLIAVDTTGNLSAEDARHLADFRARGGGLFLTRDHQDLGACLAMLGSLGETQRFHTVNAESDPARCCRDDLESPEISWPNYHSGANGALQRVDTPLPAHPLVRMSGGGVVGRLPAHPHEGVVCAPACLGSAPQVVIRGRSQTSGASFDICVAIDETGHGRAVSDSSFHHFADYNWDPRAGCPSFVAERPADEVIRHPGSMADTYAYVDNIAAWLAKRI